ncbi:hypothetical protein [Pseudarthrobacter sp. ATCC 49987]|uniref:hypothetical protein n=1 Tax=Pseudarthrobacter sp. ATCC 49987 TaxID=2698204 RepID=UPI00136A2A41|nr:hypothetical protein [Pseudarthrobacter sp. ATCC 49987]
MPSSIRSVADAYDNCLMESIIGLHKTECIRPGPFVKGPLKTVSDVECAQIDGLRIRVQTSALGTSVQRNPQSGRRLIRRLIHHASTLLAVHRFSDASDPDVLALAAQGVQVDAESNPDPFDRWVVVHSTPVRELACLVRHGWYPFCSVVPYVATSRDSMHLAVF